MKYFAVADVALLIVLFFHRYMLRKLGLWKDANIQDTFLSTKPLMDSSIYCKSESITATTTVDSITESKKNSVSIIDETEPANYDVS